MEVYSFEQYLIALLLTLFAGLSTSFGAVLAFFSKAKNERFLSLGLGFSAGVMIYVSFIEILKKAEDSFTIIYNNSIVGESLTLVCFFIGILISAFIDFLIPNK